MKYVGVKHQPDQEQIYWFSVPDALEKMVFVGAKVWCNTRIGITTGKIVMIMDGFTEPDAKRIIGDYFPLKQLAAVEREFEIAEIHIPWDMESSTPSPDKIAKRVSELYSTGSFNTDVSCSAEMNLEDGYTAYLVAKMFGHNTIKGVCCASPHSVRTRRRNNGGGDEY